MRRLIALIPGMRCWLLILVLAQSAPGDTDVWDLPPLRYSDTAATDPLSKLAAGSVAAVSE